MESCQTDKKKNARDSFNHSHTAKHGHNVEKKCPGMYILNTTIALKYPMQSDPMSGNNNKKINK